MNKKYYYTGGGAAILAVLALIAGSLHASAKADAFQRGCFYGVEGALLAMGVPGEAVSTDKVAEYCAAGASR